MERIFFSKNNYNLIYNLVGKHIYDSIGIDIASNDKYEEEIKNIMKSVYSQKKTLNINFKNLNDSECSNALSKKVLNIAINYFKNNEIKSNNKINDKKLQINQIERNNNTPKINNENKLDNRPVPSFIIEDNDVNKKYEALQNERTSILNNKPNNEPIFKDDIQQPDIDIKKIFQNISKEREKEFMNNPNNDENPSNNAWNLNRTKIASSEQNIKISDQEMNIKQPNEKANISTFDEKINIKSYEDKINTQDNQLLPSINESNNMNLDSQFNLILDNDLNDLKSKFENTSVKDRLSEFQNELSIDKNNELKMNSKPINNYDSNNLNQKKNELLMEESPVKLISPKNESFTNYQINKNKQTKMNIKKYNLIINSLDRQWYGEITEKDGNFIYYESPYTDRYKYVVNFSSNPDTTVKIPIYENNKFKPLNINKSEDKIKMLHGEVIPNDQNDGFTWNGIHYNKYNPTKEKGEIKDYYISIIKGSGNSINLDKIFKNVKKVTLKRLILPNDNDISSCCITTNRLSRTVSKYNEDLKKDDINNMIPNLLEKSSFVNTNYGNKNLPYILIHTEELNSNIEYTNNFNKSLFAKPFFDKEYSSKNSRGWSYYKNDDGDHVDFSKEVSTDLNKLTIELLKPDGTILSDVKDDLIITKIGWNSSEYNSISKITFPNNKKTEYNEFEFIILEFDKYIHESNFKNGDKIIVKNMRFKFEINDKKLNSSQQSEISNFLEYEGYVVRWDNDLYWYNLFDSGLHKTGLRKIKNPLNPDGEKIDAHGDNNHQMINRIIIKNKRTLNKNTGEYTLFGKDIRTLNPTNGFDFITGEAIDLNDENMINVYGYLINTNLQHSLILDIETEEF